MYEKLIQDIRTILPEAALRTTIMTGFPGETDESFENTFRFLESIQVDWSGCFEYSREEDTPAYDFKNRVSKKTAAKRAGRLVQLQAEITRKRLAMHVNQDFDVLIEEVLDSKEDDSCKFAIGRAWFQAPEVDGSVVVRYDADDRKAVEAVQPGRLVTVHVVASSEVDLDAVFVKDSEQNPQLPADSKLKFAVEERDRQENL